MGLVGLTYHLIQVLAWVVFRVGFGFEVRGREHLPRRGPFVLAVNHASYIDPVVVAAACPRRLVFLARESLLNTPTFGKFLRFLQTIPLQRSESEVGLREAIRVLQNGQPIAIYPEGARQQGDAPGTARPGVGLLAVCAQVPIVPVLLRGTAKALPPGARMVRPTKIQVAFSPQIEYPKNSVADRQSYQALADQVTRRWCALHEVACQR